MLTNGSTLTANKALCKIIDNMITSLTEYLAEVKNCFTTTNSKKHLFFRGHSDKNYDLKPSVFRSTSYNEKEILLDFKQYAPAHKINYDYINDRDKMLADMQHSKIPTRLLDWTLAPLIALYFACCKHKLNNQETCETIKDAEVIVLNPWGYWNEVVREKDVVEIHQIHILSRALLSGGWKFGDIKIFIEKKYGYAELIPEDIKEPFAYIASYTNNRILHQKGCFTIHGCNESDIGSIAIIEKFINRIKIDGNKKEGILKELNSLYINEYSIYPDFEGMQKMIKDTGSLFNIDYLK